MRPALLLSVLLAPIAAHAFCGFYVSGADQTLFNNATQVVLMRLLHPACEKKSRRPECHDGYDHFRSRRMIEAAFRFIVHRGYTMTTTSTTPLICRNRDMI